MLGKVVTLVAALPPTHLRNLCTLMAWHKELAIVPTVLQVTISAEVV